MKNLIVFEGDWVKFDGFWHEICEIIDNMHVRLDSYAIINVENDLITEVLSAQEYEDKYGVYI
jgi:hypothetical protein